MSLSRLKDYLFSQYRRGLEVIDIRRLAEQYGAPTFEERKNSELIDIQEMLRAHEELIGLERLAEGII